MEVLNIQETKDTPRVLFDVDKGKFEIEGYSYPENAAKFYDPLIEWMKEYCSSPLNETILKVKMTYFNTSSSKFLMDLIQCLEDVEDGNSVELHWHYDEEDFEMEEAGEEFDEIIDIPFKLIEE